MQTIMIKIFILTEVDVNIITFITVQEVDQSPVSFPYLKWKYILLQINVWGMDIVFQWWHFTDNTVLFTEG